MIQEPQSKRQRNPKEILKKPYPLSICTWFLTFFSLKFWVWGAGFFQVWTGFLQATYTGSKNPVYRTGNFKLENLKNQVQIDRELKKLQLLSSRKHKLKRKKPQMTLKTFKDMLRILMSWSSEEKRKEKYSKNHKTQYFSHFNEPVKFTVQMFHYFQ